MRRLEEVIVLREDRADLVLGREGRPAHGLARRCGRGMRKGLGGCSATHIGAESLASQPSVPAASPDAPQPLRAPFRHASGWLE